MVAGVKADSSRAVDHRVSLEAENQHLRQRITMLEKQLEFLGQHATLARGIAGEKLVSRLTGGTMTAHTAPSDVRLPNGQEIEIKFAKVSRSSKGYEGARRWQWQKIFGERNAKVFDYLFLIGESDPVHARDYRDDGSPYVIFVVPFIDVAPLTTAGTRGARGILLSTNPHRTRGTSAGLYARFQRTIVEIEAQFGLL